MARLSDVFRGDDAAYKNLKQRRVPIACEDGIMMTVKMDLNYLTCDDNSFIPSKTEQDAFLKKFRLLSKEEVEDALHVRNADFVTILNQMVPCVGCRRSAESLHQQVSRHNFSAFHPITVDAKGTLSIPAEKMTHKFLCTLFHCPSPKTTALMESLSKCKSGRRCVLHSLESQRIRTVSSWVDVWDYMDKKCQEHVVLIETKTLHETLERYLRKHRFCSECRTKVCRAYSILVKEVDHATEPGYIPQLYDGIECCKEDQHLHVLCKTDFVSRLIAKAVPELVGSRRERHAKTMEIAQEEVLICLGLTVFERLHRVQQRFREEERTWEITMNVAVQALRRNFELAVEKKLGVSQLELLCAEISKAELVKQQKKEQKKQKRRRQKEKRTEIVVSEEADTADFTEDVEIAEMEIHEEEADDASGPFVPATNPKKKKKKSGKVKLGHAQSELPEEERGRELKHSDGLPFCQSSRCSSETSRDCGYSSECNNDHATCSSPEVSEIACSDSFCNSTSTNYLHRDTTDVHPLAAGVLDQEESHRLPLPYRSLEEQLESSCSSDEENDCIPQEELSAIQNPLWGKRREQLRLEIRSKFNELILRRSPASHNGIAKSAVLTRNLDYFMGDSTATSNSMLQQHPSDDEKDSGKENYNRSDHKVKVSIKDLSLEVPVGSQQKLKSGPPKRSKGKMRR